MGYYQSIFGFYPSKYKRVCVCLCVCVGLYVSVCVCEWDLSTSLHKIPQSVGRGCRRQQVAGSLGLLLGSTGNHNKAYNTLHYTNANTIAVCLRICICVCLSLCVCVCVFACCALGAVSSVSVCLSFNYAICLVVPGLGLSPSPSPSPYRAGTWPKQNLFKLRPGIKIARLS